MATSYEHIDPKIFPDGKVVREIYAVVYSPRLSRKRFPQTCVTPCDDMNDAILKADPENNIHAAHVIGPSKSSEGVRLYYLVRWLAPHS